MKITIKDDAMCGLVAIPRGEYMVAAAPETSSIALTGGGLDLKLPAVRRPNKKKVRMETIDFYSMGGKNWTIAIILPNNRGEYVSFIQYRKSDK